MSAHALQRGAGTRQRSGFRDDRPEARIVRELELAPRGPYRLLLEPPSDGAWELAWKLTLAAMPRLQRWFVARRVTLPGGYPAAPTSALDEELLLETPRIGLPLTSVFAPGAFFHARDLFLAARFAERRRSPDRATRAAELPIFIRVEDALWRLASSEVPYAVRFALVEWFRPRTEQKPLPGICLRCGRVEPRWTWSTGPEPRCAACRKRRAEDDDPPAHAIAYASRGTYWLRCQAESCTIAFEGRRQAIFCPAHTTSRLTPSKRPALPAARPR